MGRLEPADLLRQCACVGALLPAEQLAFNQRRRDRRTVHPDHYVIAPRAYLVDGRSDQFLAGAGFSEQQDGGPGRSHLLRLSQNLIEGPALTNEATMPLLRLDLLSQVHVLLLQLIAQLLQFLVRPPQAFLRLNSLGHVLDRRDHQVLLGDRDVLGGNVLDLSGREFDRYVVPSACGWDRPRQRPP